MKTIVFFSFENHIVLEYQKQFYFWKFGITALIIFSLHYRLNDKERKKHLKEKEKEERKLRGQGQLEEMENLIGPKSKVFYFNGESDRS